MSSKHLVCSHHLHLAECLCRWRKNNDLASRQSTAQKFVSTCREWSVVCADSLHSHNNLFKFVHIQHIWDDYITIGLFPTKIMWEHYQSSCLSPKLFRRKSMNVPNSFITGTVMNEPLSVAYCCVPLRISTPPPTNYNTVIVHPQLVLGNT